MKLRNRRFPGSALLVLGLLVAGAVGLALVPRGHAAAQLATRAAATPRPNVVLIVTDDQDLRLGSLEAMPRLQELLVDQGTTFNRAYVPLSLCCPSRASILTGRYTHNLKVYRNAPPDGGYVRFLTLGHEKSTLGTALHGVGYRTALMGKYFNGYPIGSPTRVPRGWDEWAVPVAGLPYRQFGYTLNQSGTLVAYGNEPADYLTDVLADLAGDFVTRAADDDVPFFLYLAPYAPHQPSTPAPRDAELFPDAQVPRTAAFNEADVSDKPAAIRNLPPLTDQQIQDMDALYRKRLRSLQAVDAAIASLVDVLKKNGQLDNTYIFFTTDNGFHMGQHRLGASKHTPYEEDVNVPLVVRGPRVPAGARSNALVESVDLAPTIVQLAGARMRVPPDGRSFVPLLRAPRKTPAGWRQLVFLEQFTFESDGEPEDGLLEPPDLPEGEEHVTHLGMRTATYKFVEYETGEREYYDLVNDPHELQNLAGQMPLERLRRLSNRLHALSTCRESACRKLEAAALPGQAAEPPEEP